MNNMIPIDRMHAFKNVMESLFEKQDITNISLLQGGSHSKIYKVFIKDKSLIVRFMDLQEDLINRINQLQCLEAAVAIEIAPKCYYANAQEGIVISEYIENQPFSVTAKWLQEIADILRRLHGYRQFPSTFQPLFNYIHDLSNIIRDLSPSVTLINYLDDFAGIMEILSKHLVLTSAHNDLNHKNILFNNRSYLIDWEAAGMEDPFFDLATICNEFARSTEAKDYFTHQYFGRLPTVEQQAKILLMQQVSHAYLGLHYLLHANSGGLSLNEVTLENIPTLQEWKEGNVKGIYQENSAKDFLVYAMTQIKESLQRMNSKEFQNAKDVLRA